MLGNINIINKIVARRKNIPENTVAKINEFYFKKTEQELRSSEKVNFFLRSLGTISVSHFKIRKEILRTIIIIRTITAKEYNNPQKKEEALKVYREYLKLIWKQYKEVNKIKTERSKKIKDKLNNKHNAQATQTDSVNHTGILHPSVEA